MRPPRNNSEHMRAMRAVSIIAVLLLLAAIAFALLLAANAFASAPLVNMFALPPEVSAYQPYVLGAALALGLVVLVTLLAGRPPSAETARATAEAARPISAPPPANQAEAEIVSFLATLQAKGRLVDFLMDDINAYGDAQVGAAARVVHAGCKGVLQEHFSINPVRTEQEGSTVQVPAGYSADEYRLIGKIAGSAPFTGVLVHRGWKTDRVKLPQLLSGADDPLPAIAPAEVEVK